MDTIKVGCPLTRTVKFFPAENLPDDRGVYYPVVLDAPDGCGQYRECARCFEYVSEWVDQHRMTAFTEIVYP
jgi:hypothetical protein